MDLLTEKNHLEVPYKKVALKDILNLTEKLCAVSFSIKLQTCQEQSLYRTLVKQCISISISSF